MGWFACPEVAASRGRPLGQHTSDIKAYLAEIESANVAGRTLAPPPLQGNQTVEWSDLDTLVQGLGIVVSERQDRVERRLRKCLWLANTCRQAKFDKISGKRLEDFLSILIGAADPELPTHPAALPAPSGVGRILFRQMLALFSRADSGAIKGRASRNRVALLMAAIRFARGSGPVPPVNALIPETTFEKLEAPLGPLPAECEMTLERYYLVKLHSMQFFGPTNFRHTFWDGLESLVLTYPVIMWLTRALAQTMPVHDALLRQRITDNNFGFQPLLGSGRQKFVSASCRSATRSRAGRVVQPVGVFDRLERFRGWRSGLRAGFSPQSFLGFRGLKPRLHQLECG